MCEQRHRTTSLSARTCTHTTRRSGPCSPIGVLESSRERSESIVAVGESSCMGSDMVEQEQRGSQSG